MKGFTKKKNVVVRGAGFVAVLLKVQVWGGGFGDLVLEVLGGADCPQYSKSLVSLLKIKGRGVFT